MSKSKFQIEQYTNLLECTMRNVRKAGAAGMIDDEFSKMNKIVLKRWYDWHAYNKRQPCFLGKTGLSKFAETSLRGENSPSLHNYCPHILIMNPTYTKAGILSD